jgi:hypothetical protein
MADLVGTIIGIVQLAATVVQYLNDVKDASKDSHEILVEVSSTTGILISLKDLVSRSEQGEKWLDTIRSLGMPDGPLNQFQASLETLSTALEPAVGLRKLGKSFTWPWRQKDVKKILERIERQRSLFVLALQNDHMLVQYSLILSLIAFHL